MTSLPWILILLLHLSGWPNIGPGGVGAFDSSFTAYDCEHKDARFTEIDLLQPQDCPDPETDYEEPVVVPVQILHMETRVAVRAYSCKVLVTKKISRCGFDSLHYGNTYAAYNKHYTLTPEECRTAARTGVMEVYNRKFPIAMNQKATEHFFSYGSRDKDGNCKTTTFTSEGVEYTGSYEEVFIDAVIKQTRGIIDYTTGDIRFTNGIVARATDLMLRDSIEGLMIWYQPAVKCDKTVSEVYRGAAEIRTRKGMPERQDTVVLVENNDTKQYAGLVLTHKQKVCGKWTYMTHLGKGLAVYFVHEGGSGISVPEVGKQFDVEQRNIQTQISYLALDLRLKYHTSWIDIQQDICGLDRRTLYTRLQIIGDTSNPYALQDLFGSGHSIRRAGAVAYVTQCVPVEVVLTSHTNCTHEIPATYGNYTVFVDPITKIVRPYPNVVPCSTLHPVKWKIDDQWVSATPKTQVQVAPHRLNLTFGIVNYPESFSEGLGRGLYTQQQLNEHRMFIRSQDTRSAVVSKVTNAAIRNAHHVGVLGLPLSADDLPDLSAYVTWDIFPLAYFFGDAWHWISGLILFIGVIKIVLGSFIRMMMAYKKRGCGWWMFSALWATGFMVIMYPFELISKAIAAAEESEGSLPGEGERIPLHERSTFKDLEAQLTELRMAQNGLLRKYDQIVLEKMTTYPNLSTLETAPSYEQAAHHEVNPDDRPPV